MRRAFEVEKQHKKGFRLTKCTKRRTRVSLRVARFSTSGAMTGGCSNKTRLCTRTRVPNRTGVSTLYHTVVLYSEIHHGGIRILKGGRSWSRARLNQHRISLAPLRGRMGKLCSVLHALAVWQTLVTWPPKACLCLENEGKSVCVRENLYSVCSTVPPARACRRGIARLRCLSSLSRFPTV